MVNNPITQFFNNPITQFVIGGSLVATITYITNNVDPGLASVITAFPIGLVPLFFVHQQTRIKEFGIDTTITNIIVVTSYLFFDFLVNRKSLAPHAISLTIVIWIIQAVILYYIFFRKK